MTFGFRIRDPLTGALRMSSDDLGLLFLDQFDMAPGTTTRTYPGVASSEIKVISLGANGFGGSATVTVGSRDGAAVVTVTTKANGWYIVSRE